MPILTAARSASASHLGTPSAEKAGVCVVGQQRATKSGRRRPTCAATRTGRSRKAVNSWRWLGHEDKQLGSSSCWSIEAVQGWGTPKHMFDDVGAVGGYNLPAS